MRKTHIGFACVTKSDWSGGCFLVAIQDSGGTNIKWFQCIDQTFESHVLNVWFRVKHCFVLSISVAFYGSQKEHLTKSVQVLLRRQRILLGRMCYPCRSCKADLIDFLANIGHH